MKPSECKGTSSFLLARVSFFGLTQGCSQLESTKFQLDMMSKLICGRDILFLELYCTHNKAPKVTHLNAVPVIRGLIYFQQSLKKNTHISVVVKEFGCLTWFGQGATISSSLPNIQPRIWGPEWLEGKKLMGLWGIDRFGLVWSCGEMIIFFVVVDKTLGYVWIRMDYGMLGMFTDNTMTWGKKGQTVTKYLFHMRQQVRLQNTLLLGSSIFLTQKGHLGHPHPCHLQRNSKIPGHRYLQ